MGNDKAEREKRSNPAPTKKSGGRQTAGNYTPVIWVSYQFTPEDKVRIKAAELDLEKAIDALATMVERGHKVSCNPSTSDGFVGISVWGHTDDCPNKGYGVSGEGGSFYAALKSLFFKLEFLQYNLYVPEIQDEDDFS